MSKWSHVAWSVFAVMAVAYGSALGQAQSESYGLTAHVVSGGGGAAASESVSGFFVLGEPVVGQASGTGLHLDAGMLGSAASVPAGVVMELAGYQSSYRHGDPFAVVITITNHGDAVSGFTRAEFSAVSDLLDYRKNIYNGPVYPLPPGQSLSYTYRLPGVPPVAPFGSYTITFAIDYQGDPIASASFETDVVE